MKEAPASGYEKEVVLAAADFAERGLSNDRPLFYFKINGKYGKDNVGEVVVSKDGSTAELGARFSLQPDGFRNLETED